VRDCNYLLPSNRPHSRMNRPMLMPPDFFWQKTTVRGRILHVVKFRHHGIRRPAAGAGPFYSVKISLFWCFIEGQVLSSIDFIGRHECVKREWNFPSVNHTVWGTYYWQYVRHLFNNHNTYHPPIYYKNYDVQQLCTRYDTSSLSLSLKGGSWKSI
jgi:hypothetical protein